jgi:hypothetical protein
MAEATPNAEHEGRERVRVRIRVKRGKRKPWLLIVVVALLIAAVLWTSAVIVPRLLTSVSNESGQATQSPEQQ